jgi:hypothetical protein
VCFYWDTAGATLLRGDVDVLFVLAKHPPKNYPAYGRPEESMADCGFAHANLATGLASRHA